MSRFLFVGERPSPLAHRTGATWAAGRLAGKQLHDALRQAGLNPADQKYDNVFVPDPDGPEEVCRKAIRRIRRCGLPVVAMGNKVAEVLTGLGLPHLRIVHPAARGRIRKKHRYAAHVREALAVRNV